MNKKLLIILGLFFITSVIAGISIENIIDKDVTLTKDEVISLKEIGIDNPTISNCEKSDEFNCKTNVYQKGGINKDLEVVIKECTEYETIYSNGECLEYEILETQGDCINWTDENKTECQENETVYSNGECLEYEILESQGNCSVWWNLNQQEIETRVQEKTKELLESIVVVKNQREEEVKEYLTDKINLEIKSSEIKL